MKFPSRQEKLKKQWGDMRTRRKFLWLPRRVTDTGTIHWLEFIDVHEQVVRYHVYNHLTRQTSLIYRWEEIGTFY